jgi:hypothetical protein
MEIVNDIDEKRRGEERRGEERRGTQTGGGKKR